MNLFDLSGKKAIVTGAARGIGEALAKALGAYGADVAVNYAAARDRADRVVEDIQAMGRNAFSIQADVSDEADVERMTKEVMDRFGRVDILINNAGIIFAGGVEDYSLEHWRRTFAVNVEGVFLCSKHVGKHMIAQKGGAIVNVGSMSGKIVNWPFRHAAYNATKAAVHQFTKNLAVEWAEHNIRVNAIAPGYIRTELVDDVLAKNPAVLTDHWGKDTIMGRIGEVDELAGAVVWLCSDSASFTTGEVIFIDGGLTLR
ncbi:MAG: 3-oxoacyl-ACP reductase FabG [Alphaproteobacteria bacterium]|nr:3-oxoacyl-ACP reductase FabG [Alphaproteobacteria bacterium]